MQAFELDFNFANETDFLLRKSNFPELFKLIKTLKS